MSETAKTGYPHIDKPWMKFYDSELLGSEDPKTNLADYLRQKNLRKIFDSTFKIRNALRLTKNSKVSFTELIDEGLDSTEIDVGVEETNLAVGDIRISAGGH